MLKSILRALLDRYRSENKAKILQSVVQYCRLNSMRRETDSKLNTNLSACLLQLLYNKLWKTLKHELKTSQLTNILYFSVIYLRNIILWGTLNRATCRNKNSREIHFDGHLWSLEVKNSARTHMSRRVLLLLFLIYGKLYHSVSIKYRKLGIKYPPESKCTKQTSAFSWKVEKFQKKFPSFSSERASENFSSEYRIEITWNIF